MKYEHNYRKSDNENKTCENCDACSNTGNGFWCVIQITKKNIPKKVHPDRVCDRWI